MRKLKTFILVVILIGFVIATTLFFIGYFRPKPAGVLVDASPTSSVYIDGQLVGKTPYETTRDGDEVVIRLVPESPELLSNVFETKVKLSPGIKTIVKREFGATEAESQGEIMSFERVGGYEASLAIISIPDAAQITIDGKIAGFSPYKTNLITAGDHQIVVSSTGYTEKAFTVRTYTKYKLTAVVQLAKLPIVAPEEEVENEVKQVFVEIGPTSVGFLRVREKPSSGSAELARVTPGQKLPFVSEETNLNWFEIEYETGKTGWVSGEFAKKVEE